MIFVVAGNFMEYRDYCESVGESPYFSENLTYVYALSNLLGRIDIEILLVGTFDKRYDWPTIHRYCVKRWQKIRLKRL